MRIRRVGVVAVGLLLAACGAPVGVTDDPATSSTTTTAVDDGVTEASTSTSSTADLTTTTSVEVTTSTSSPTAATTTGPPQPNRPPVIEDPGVSLSIAPTDDAFTLVIDPVVFDPDGDDVAYSLLGSAGSLDSFQPPLEVAMDMNDVLTRGGAAVLLTVQDADSATEAEVELDLAGLDVIGSLSGFRLEISNPGACFFALPTRVERMVEVSIWFKGDSVGPPDVTRHLTFSDTVTSHDLPGFLEQVMAWNPDQPLFGIVSATVVAVGQRQAIAAVRVPYRASRWFSSSIFSAFPCNFEFSGVADSRLSLNQ